jgi:hypothetical protein
MLWVMSRLLCHSCRVGEATVQGLDDTSATAVDEAMAGIADLDQIPVADHVARFDAVHRALADALSAIDGA